ncbi:uncharacterized protein LOC135812133 isoform X2 [Sycon ciliatum]|uniref:uncharacterized protein LOC135812133 isoform X2 n=1 Tax=Sycon ciliatum TaxID=27933 RepID=UPI0031F5F777
MADSPGESSSSSLEDGVANLNLQDTSVAGTPEEPENNGEEHTAEGTGNNGEEHTAEETGNNAVKRTRLMETPVNVAMTMSVEKVPGIGPKTRDNLRGAGYETISQLLAKFLMESGDPVLFQYWMRRTGFAKRDHAEDCYEAIHAYYHAHKGTLSSFVVNACACPKPLIPE